MSDPRIRYCQRCSTLAMLSGSEVPNPCRTCGSTNFGLQPVLHSVARGYELTEADRDFLRTQGIDPEEY